MRTVTVIERIGENMGPVDWSHPMIAELNPGLVAKLREAEAGPSEFHACTFYSSFMHDVYAVCMYDGWPYWQPTPSVQMHGTLGAEWHAFRTISIIERRKATVEVAE